MPTPAASAALSDATLPRVAAEHRAVPARIRPDHPATSPRTVKNCTDHDADSLRDIVQNQAQSGDTVDLSQLPILCGTTDSKITLTSGEIVVAKDDLMLLGPDSAKGIVTISGGGASRVFHHEGTGTLSLASLTVADGYYHIAGAFAYGGCIESNFGNIYLNRTVVTGCTALNDTGAVAGGGISASVGNVALVLSTVSQNQAKAPASWGIGGGIYASGTLTAKYSTITSNAVHGGQGQGGYGGGAFSLGAATIHASVVDDNAAEFASGLEVSSAATISNSTISRNIASSHGALYCSDCNSASITNSTIAFNHQDSAPSAGALLFYGLNVNSALTLQSSIIANNTAGAGNVAADLWMTPGYGLLSAAGADNLVVASNVLSPPPGVITVTTDPKLGPLQFNGGRTRTHALLPGSPALAMGNNTAMRMNDQRGDGYPRTTGANASVDIGAFQFDSIFADGFDTQ